MQFENYVNYAGSKTSLDNIKGEYSFENYVNYAGSKTILNADSLETWFENYVNYAGSKTDFLHLFSKRSLRTM